MPDLDTPQGAAAYAEEWDSYVGDVGAALQASSGLEREKLAAQMKDAQAGRANAYKIAKLQADVSRYGIDMQRKTALDQLKENARQFDASHLLEKEKFAFEKESWAKEFGLEEKKFGLNYAQAATEYLSTPDRAFMFGDFQDALSRAAVGSTGGGETAQGPRPYGATGTPIPKTQDDFAVLASYGQTPQAGQPSPAPALTGQTPVPAGGSSDLVQSALDGPSAWSAHGTPSSPAMGGTPGEQRVGTNPVNDANGDGVPDPRPKVLTAMMKEMPPSNTPGHDSNDLAILEAARALYATNWKPGMYESLRPGQQAMLQGAGKRLGYYVPDKLADYERSKPWQRSVRSA
jgi:hypothetical protein